VYVHPIVVPITRTPRRDLHKCAELTGPKSAKNVVLATTKWDTLDPKFEEIGKTREEGLRKEFWNIMIHHGAAVQRFLNDSGSAWSIVENVVKKNDQMGVISRKKKDIFKSIMISILRSLPKSSTQDSSSKTNSHNSSFSERTFRSPAIHASRNRVSRPNVPSA
jgi:hypothetical protein